MYIKHHPDLEITECERNFVKSQVDMSTTFKGSEAVYCSFPLISLSNRSQAESNATGEAAQEVVGASLPTKQACIGMSSKSVDKDDPESSSVGCSTAFEVVDIDIDICASSVPSMEINDADVSSINKGLRSYFIDGLQSEVGKLLRLTKIDSIDFLERVGRCLYPRIIPKANSLMICKRLDEETCNIIMVSESSTSLAELVVAIYAIRKPKMLVAPTSETSSNTIGKWLLHKRDLSSNEHNFAMGFAESMFEIPSATVNVFESVKAIYDHAFTKAIYLSLLSDEPTDDSLLDLALSHSSLSNLRQVEITDYLYLAKEHDKEHFTKEAFKTDVDALIGTWFSTASDRLRYFKNDGEDNYNAAKHPLFLTMGYTTSLQKVDSPLLSDSTIVAKRTYFQLIAHHLPEFKELKTVHMTDVQINALESLTNSIQTYVSDQIVNALLSGKRSFSDGLINYANDLIKPNSDSSFKIINAESAGDATWIHKSIQNGRNYFTWEAPFLDAKNCQDYFGKEICLYQVNGVFFKFTGDSFCVIHTSDSFILTISLDDALIRMQFFSTTMKSEAVTSVLKDAFHAIAQCCSVTNKRYALEELRATHKARHISCN
jgi:hypothetical protein